MADIKLNSEDWAIVSIKFKRKYNHLTENDLAYTPGQEDELIQRLARLVHRDEKYITFTLKKMLLTKTSNRL